MGSGRLKDRVGQEIITAQQSTRGRAGGMAGRTVYSKSMKTYTDPKNDPLWKETYSIAEYMYGRQEEITAKSPDERWITASKIRTLANDVMFYVSLAVGSSLSYTAEYEWNSARKNLWRLYHDSK